MGQRLTQHLARMEPHLVNRGTPEQPEQLQRRSTSVPTPIFPEEHLECGEQTIRADTLELRPLAITPRWTTTVTVATGICWLAAALYIPMMAATLLVRQPTFRSVQ